MSKMWLAVAAVGVIALLWGFGRFLIAARPDPRLRDVPPTPIERLAHLGMGISLSVGTGMVALVAAAGVDGLQEESWARGTFAGLVIVGVGVWMTAWHRTSRSFRDATMIDERDRDALARSFSVESMIVLVSLVAWTVALTEAFWDEGSIPIAYLQLLFWSVFLASVFGRSLGVVLAYRRMP